MLSTLWKPCVRFFLLFTLVCGVLYTGSVTILAQLFFPAQANGSLVEKDGVVVGSTAIGQPFKDDDHLWGRPASIDVTSFQDEFGQPLVYGAPANHVRSDSAYQQDLSTVKYTEPERKAILKAYRGRYGGKVWKGSIYDLYRKFLEIGRAHV